MGRWSPEEERLIKEVREKCAKELANVMPFPEVVGDRRIIRFIRAKYGNPNGLNESIKLYREFLIWRKENNIDYIRNKIVYEGCNNPLAFPNGPVILDLQPTIVIAPDATDKKGQPIVLELYGRNPALLLEKVSISEYIQFLIYCLEFRAIILEQISDLYEKEYLAKCSDESIPDNYGVVLKTCIIRDLNGVGVRHIEQKARDVIKAGLSVAIPNYPEYLGKSHLINVPWFFNMIWVMIKGFLDANILSKISLNGPDFIKALKDEIAYDSIPHEVGGGFFGSNKSFDFDISENGPLWYPGAPSLKVSYDSSVGLDSAKRRSRSSSLGNLELSGRRLSGAGSSPLSTPVATIRKRLSNNVSDKSKKRLSSEKLSSEKLSSDNLANAPVTLVENVATTSCENSADTTSVSESDSKSRKIAPTKSSIKSVFFAAVTNPVISCVYALVLFATLRSLKLILLVLLPIALYYILQVLQ